MVSFVYNLYTVPKQDELKDEEVSIISEESLKTLDTVCDMCLDKIKTTLKQKKT